MRILITGANGFVGRALARRLADAAVLDGRPIEALHLLDLGFETPPAAPAQTWAVDLGDAAALQPALDRIRAAGPLSHVFHLASIPGGLAEQQPDLAQRVNIAATLALLEHGRAQAEAGHAPPVFVFASSIAVLGELTGPVDDHTPPQPVMGYGAHKWVGEILVAAHSRRGWVDGRSLRLPGVLARPPARTGQLSAFLSDMLRELAAGRPFVCPMSAQASTWASSLPCVIDQLLHAATLDARALAVLGPSRCVTLPTLRFAMAELVDAVAAVHGVAARDLVRHAPEPRIEALFGRFPPLHTPAAEAAGFGRDADLQALVRAAL